MRQLQLMTVMAALTTGLVFGCDNTSETDAGSGGRDSGPVLDGGGGGGTDAGPGGTDGGGGGTDAGGTMSMCSEPPLAGDCSLLDPSSCGTGMACVPVAASSGTGAMAGCVAATVAGRNDSCDLTGMGCQEGFFCFEGACRQFCGCTNADCDVAGDFCLTFGGLGVGGCIEAVECDLVRQSGCPAEKGCYVTPGGRLCVTPGTLAEGTACSSLSDCSAGHVCIGSPGTCRRFCDMAATDACPSGFMCNGLTGAPTGVGVCVPTT